MDLAPGSALSSAFYPLDDKDSSSSNNKIRRPPNAFMMFAREYRPVLLNKTPNVENKFISIKLGQMWKAMSPQQKAKYFYMAKLAEQRHRQLYPDYRYVPKRKKTAEESIQQVNLAYINERGNQGPYSLSRKLEALSKTVCDAKSANPIAYIKHPNESGMPTQMYVGPQQQIRTECSGDLACHQGIIGHPGHAFQPVMSSAYQQVPVYQDMSGRTVTQPMLMNQMYCDATGKGDLQPIGVESVIVQNPTENTLVQKTQNVVNMTEHMTNEQDNDQPTLKKMYLRSINDPEKTIEVMSPKNVTDGVYFIQSEMPQQHESQIKKDYKNEETYVKVADKTYTDISNNIIQPAQPSKETNYEILNQWIQFFQSVMPGENTMKDTQTCPCLAFLSCSEEFAIKLGWKPGELGSLQNFIKKRLSSIVGENGITGPCSNNQEEQEAAAPVTSTEAASCDNTRSDYSSVYEDTSSNSMNAFSFSESTSSSTCSANENIDCK